MLILHTAPSYAPDVGGLAEVVRQIATRLACRGDEVHVATGMNLSQVPVEDVEGVHVHRFACQSTPSLGAQGDVDGYLRFVRSKHWDVVTMHFLSGWTSTALLPYLDEIHGGKVLVGHGFRHMQHPHLARRIEDLARHLHNVDHIVTLSPKLEERLLCERYNLPSPEVIPNGVDLAEWSAPLCALRLNWGIAARPWLVNVSNHSPIKRHEAFFEVARLVRQALPETVATIIGGHYPAARWGLGRFGVRGGCWYRCRFEAGFSRGIELRWNVPRAEVVSAVRESSVTLLTSAFEASPLTILESMAAGIPWVSFDVGCVREYVGGVVVKDVVEMVDATLEFLRNPERARAVGEQGHRRVHEQHSWDDIVRRYESLYDRLSAGGRRDR
jgi:glycosyltransferase involved in cell wall biosynthesis